MLNVFDIKRNNNLNFILPLDYKLRREAISVNDVLIVIHLFYETRLEKFLKYIEHIPSNIDILFTTSNQTVQNELKIYMKHKKRKCKFIKKDNRGRDISGLLVACRSEILKYKYVCFLHDKKEKSELIKKDVDIFINCLWENMIGSSTYIFNIIEIFEKNSKLGLLLPPEPISGNFSFPFLNTWYLNFENMQSLARKMSLECDLDIEKKPLSVGTVFWARVNALRKLFERDWKYEDFDEEPLPDDGTISHAIERSFAYIAQDAGYDTGIVMTDQFAGRRVDSMQEILTDAFELMKELLDISTVNNLKKKKKFYGNMAQFVSMYSHIYIYGAGKYGQDCVNILNLISCKVEAFIVSNIDENPKECKGIPIIPFSEVSLDKNSGIIVAVSDKFKEEIIKKIKTKYPLYNNIFWFTSKVENY